MYFKGKRPQGGDSYVRQPFAFAAGAVTFPADRPQPLGWKPTRGAAQKAG